MEIFAISSYARPMQREHLQLSDGRNLEFLRNGIQSDASIILHAGTMQDITGWKIWLDYFADQGIAALSFGRSGYVASTKKPGRITIDIAKDVAQLADYLKLNRMVQVGLSGGGQHAIASGLDPRTVGVVTVGSLAPYPELGETFFTGMQQSDLDEYQDALRDMNDLIKRFQGYMNSESGEPEIPMEIEANDKKAQASPSWPILMESISYTGSNGWDWVADDYSSYLQPWGMDPREVKIPVSIWQGGLDQNVPPQHGRWLSSNIPNSTLHLIEDESHIGLFINYEKEIMQNAIALLRA